ncbi:stage VI sporulation protein D [Neobacillus sp. PS3-34]|uniref:stage VI sporulation protein D n=1 Tax=Neobacillus sp. PS3-34 TaxID=3070678 RepID=UPI0027E09ABD|nr:stage VI sporulation protein D [Neobacillus sp. PS3-34]WML47364.1 stage VI sporulation protein D [Neobacillus sp. PS3-34]
MSQENQSCLRFSLEESIWFRKGQEVEELVSISLDPDITIQENDQYVTIRGSLELTGEYKSHNDSSENEEDPGLKYVQVVEEREAGVCEFSHRFPVDITIPNNRIQSIYDIDVVVESFDYSFPERSCMKLTSDLTISGLYGEQQHETAPEQFEPVVLHRNPQEDVEEVLEQEEQEQDAHYYASYEEDSFEAEARRQFEDEPPAEQHEFPTFPYQGIANSHPLDLFKQYARSEASTVPDTGTEEQFEQGEVTSEVQQAEHHAESSSSPEKAPVQQEVKKKKAPKKKSMSLTEFFARKEESDEVAKLKVCIVQRGETLDVLSERYDISVPNLLRVNNLEMNQDVYEGQVLYIPVVVAKK